MREFFVLDGKSSEDFGLFVDTVNLYGSPKRNVDMYSIPGSNNPLLVDRGSYEQLPIEINAFFVGEPETRLREIRDWIGSITELKKLSISCFPDEYFMAYPSGSPEITVSKNPNYTSIKLKFTRRAERFRTDGDMPIPLTSTSTEAVSATVINTTMHDAFPLYRFYGSGKIEVNGAELTMNQPNADLLQDGWYCEFISEKRVLILHAFWKSNGEPAIGKFMYTGEKELNLVPGENTIKWTPTDAAGGTLQIIPRWWTL